MSLKQALTHSCLFNTSNTYSEGRSQLCIIIPTQYNPTSKDSHSDSHRKDSSLGLNPWLKRHCMLNCIFIKCIYNRKKNHGKTSNTYSWGMDDDYSYRFGLNKTAPSFGLEEHLQNHTAPQCPRSIKNNFYFHVCDVLLSFPYKLHCSCSSPPSTRLL